MNKNFFRNKSILITGGTGSFGKALVSYLINNNYPLKKIIVFSISTKLEFKEDLVGQYGVGPNTFYIPVSSEEEGKRWILFLESEDYKTIALATKTNRQFLKNTFIQHLICPK